jgi:hypothetical protein
MNFESLSEESLTALITGQICVLRVPDFIPQEVCEQLAVWYGQHPKSQNYTHEVYVDGNPVQIDMGVTRIGTPYNLTYGKTRSGSSFQKYYDDALPNIMEMRNACSPFLAPMDKFRLLLDELYVHGAQIARFDGKPMFAGIGRITRPNALKLEEQPHFDTLPQEYGLEQQFGVNIYLAVPEKGGELEIWDHTPMTADQVSSEDLNKDWRSELGDSYRIVPQQGDLVVINTGRAHAVRRFQNGSRISISCFIGYKKGEPLLLWS